MSKTFFAMTAVGKDRPGIVAAVTRVLFELGCNIEDSSHTILGGEFAIILLLTAPDGVTRDRLETSLREAGSPLGLTVNLCAISETELTRTKDNRHTLPFLISVYGSDHPGIVYRITRHLAEKDVNITDMNTKVIRKNETTTYVMMLEIEIPSEVNPSHLTLELEAIGKDLGVQVGVRPMEVAEL
ncbi:MAG: amino acid-binding protein [Blastocatellia bacterium]|nr:amino acid-binding protein [Blastocatellia bacterium]